MPSSRKIIRGLPEYAVSNWKPSIFGQDYSSPVDKILTEISLNNPDGFVVKTKNTKKAKSENELLQWESEIEKRLTQVKKIEEEARKLAIEQGFEQGYAEGTSLAKNETEILNHLATQLSQEFITIKTRLADEIIELSMHIAKRILMDEISHKPESVCHALLKTLENLPLTPDKITILSHPDTLSVLQKHPIQHPLFESIQWQTQTHQTPGGFIIRFDGGEIDATLSTRWKRVVEQLGQTDTNLEL